LCGLLQKQIEKHVPCGIADEVRIEEAGPQCAIANLRSRHLPKTGMRFVGDVGVLSPFSEP
jgi:hypothetical protein